MWRFCCQSLHASARQCMCSLNGARAPLHGGYGGADRGIIVELICHSRPFIFNYHVVYDNTRKIMSERFRTYHSPHTARGIDNRESYLKNLGRSFHISSSSLLLLRKKNFFWCLVACWASSRRSAILINTIGEIVPHVVLSSLDMKAIISALPSKTWLKILDLLSTLISLFYSGTLNAKSIGCSRQPPLAQSSSGRLCCYFCTPTCHRRQFFRCQRMQLMLPKPNRALDFGKKLSLS